MSKEGGKSPRQVAGYPRALRLSSNVAWADSATSARRFWESKAAVLGGTFEFGQLISMANEHNEDALLDLLEEALQAGLLKEEGAGTRITYHFCHPLIVSHLYERLSAARCAQLYRRAANIMLNT